MPPTLATSATPGDGGQLRADVPVLDGPQPARVVAGALDRVPEDLPGGGRVRAEGRRHARRQVAVSPSSRSATRRRASGTDTESSKITLEQRVADVAGAADDADAVGPLELQRRAGR